MADQIAMFIVYLIFSKRILYLFTKKSDKAMNYDRKNIFELVQLKIIKPINLEGT